MMLDCIMSIDDDDATNFYNQTIIKRLNIIKDHLVYDDAEKALTYLSQPSEEIKVPDLILLDINMPKVNGWDFLDKYVANGFDKKFDKTKIIVITTSNNPSDLMKVEKYDCVAGLENKVIDPEKIKNLFSNYFGYSFT
ncbi:response regulator [Flammeovirga yaeyamensis]|uniref:Response regulator n=1 Tax=Flammeovirga yaeyamensis TaxID=367791 RepID=A0AAX1N704_9BACT|nr:MULTISPECIES: response regulator [Flammeovirga]ANQ49480.2 response regulator [Flammeovirga sp. MY04]MBB3697619.1 CheY-like chemotaxis protein [Flammeovirga yaeyamensis]QWG03036.1 response regulator [Flammeovirga yaeyamensis]